MQWYYAIDEQRLGPVPHAELERLVQAGTIKGDTLLWRQGMDQWKTFAEVKERDPAMFAEAPPPLPEREPASEALAEEEMKPFTSTRRPSGSGSSFGEESAAPETMIYGGFWRRAGAFLVDLVIWFFVWEILSSVIILLVFPEMKEVQEAFAAAGSWMTYKPTPEHLAIMTKAYPVTLLVGLLWAVVYDVIFLRRFSATPGKLLVGLRVVRTDGEPLGVSRIVARCLVKIIAGMPTLCIGWLIVAFDDEKRGLHDFFCKTRVVKKR